MEQSAVEWLESNLYHTPEDELHFKHNEECWQQAKEMEKEQMIEFASYYTPLTKEELEIGFKHKFKNKNNMGILKDKANSLKNDPWYKKLRRWIKFKLWLWKHELNKSE